MGYITVTFVTRHDAETDQYVSRCEELGVSSSHQDLDQAFARITEATSLYLQTLEQVGELGRVLQERGVRIMQGEPPQAELDVRASDERQCPVKV